jgi:hypothetical protein
MGAWTSGAPVGDTVARGAGDGDQSGATGWAGEAAGDGAGEGDDVVTFTFTCGCDGEPASARAATAPPARATAITARTPSRRPIVSLRSIVIRS